MRRSSRFALGPCLLLLTSLATGCKGWRPQQPHDVAALADPNATFSVVLDTLKAQKYNVIDQNAGAHAVRVRSHVDESDPGHVSVISVSVDGAAVRLSASGYLVRPDGTTHHALNSELASLQSALQKSLGSHAKASAAPPPSAPVGPSVAIPVATPSGSLPAAWSEPAYDPAVWGRGNFTCLPIKLADEEQSQLTLKLSNGEVADVQLSLAHAPELCRSPAACKLPGGCPALGIADTEHVSRLASRLSRHEIGPLATLFSRGQAVATIDLSKHGSIAQAMAEKR